MMGKQATKQQGQLGVSKEASKLAGTHSKLAEPQTLNASTSAPTTQAAAKHFRRASHWGGLLIVWLLFLFIAAVLFAERSGVQYAATDTTENYLSGVSAEQNVAPQEQAAHCLILTDSSQYGATQACDMFVKVLSDMKVSYQTFDLQQQNASDIPPFEQYQTVLVLMPRIDVMSPQLERLMTWVEAGGNLMLGMKPERTSNFLKYKDQFGMVSCSLQPNTIESIVPTEDFMMGGGQRYEISDPFKSGLAVSLKESAHVWARSGDRDIPLIWSNDYGQGRTVVCNIGVYVKALRGFYAAAYSLMSSACAYPVINSAVFYLDDFPSPVPAGNSEYIHRDYGLSTADFYSRIWWPDLTRLAQKYGIYYTGVMIENYGDDTSGSTQRQVDEGQFQYYGGLLLRMGGELGYHGYNHQPLVLSNTDYQGRYAYKQWKSVNAIVASLNELINFQMGILPYVTCSVYVPPSNILSSEGREAIAQQVPQIRTIASTYFETADGLPYVQEFEVAQDGIVEQPRIVSGSMVGDGFMRLAAVSELNMHFVSTHFMHPDDLLDEDRGAADGWEAYKAGLVDYLEWLEDAAPIIRKQTGSECSGAIQQFYELGVDMSVSDDAWVLNLSNFEDSAQLLFRANDGVPGQVEGGTLTNLTGNLYLLEAQEATVTIQRQAGA